MPNKKTFSLFITLLLFGFAVKANEIDSTVTILSSSSSYVFAKEKGSNKIVVKEIQKIKYKCSRPTLLPVSAYYNENSKITSFECKINNRSLYYRPTDSYVAIQDIFYSDARVLYYELNVPANGIVDVTIEKSTFNPNYFTSVQFTESFKTLNREVSIKIPKWMNVSFKELNFDGYGIQKTSSYVAKDDSDVISYKAANLTAYKKRKKQPRQYLCIPSFISLSQYRKETYRRRRGIFCFITRPIQLVQQLND